VQYQFTGRVTGSYVAGLTVVLGGQPQSLQDGSVTAIVQSDGTFSVTVNMVNGANDSGWACAMIVADGWGYSSNQANALVTLS
jgi:hypothetical protein